MSAVQHIRISLDFPCPDTTLFSQLANHDNLGRLLSQKMVRETPEHLANGIDQVGSVRRIGLGLGLSFDEQITRCEAPNHMSYKVVRGSPIQAHQGRIDITPTEQGCHLDYCIDFEPKWAIPGWGALLRWAIQRSIEKPLRQFAGDVG